MKRWLAFAAVAILTGCSNAGEEAESVPNEEIVYENPAEEENQTEEQITEEIEPGVLSAIATNLQIPWSITKHGETFYISERVGSIVRIVNGVMERQPVKLSEELSDAAEAGLLGFVLAPDFDRSQHAFAYYTYTNRGKPTNRIVLLELDEGEWVEKDILLDRIPSGFVHHGGRMKIGPDGKLYVTTGDAATPELAQNLSSLAGKILRMNLNGSIPADNPIADSYVYSYGHRNPQGLAWTEEGKMYASEHGNNANDEINEITAGENYGWPLIQGLTSREGMVTPIFTSGENETWAPSGIVYHNEKLYVSALRGTALLQFDLTNETVTRLVDHVGRIRDVWLEGDILYFVTNNTDGRGSPSAEDDQLYRIRIE